MIYSVHGYFGKINSRKQQSKIETIVFAEDRDLAEKLVKDLFDGYPANFERFSVVGGQERDLNKIYEERPELRGIDPKKGYVYNEFYFRNDIARYYKTK